MNLAGILNSLPVKSEGTPLGPLDLERESQLEGEFASEMEQLLQGQGAQALLAGEEQGGGQISSGEHFQESATGESKAALGPRGKHSLVPQMQGLLERLNPDGEERAPASSGPFESLGVESLKLTPGITAHFKKGEKPGPLSASVEQRSNHLRPDHSAEGPSLETLKSAPQVFVPTQKLNTVPSKKSFFLNQDQLKEKFMQEHMGSHPLLAKKLEVQDHKISSEGTLTSLEDKALGEGLQQKSAPFISPYTLKILERQMRQNKVSPQVDQFAKQMAPFDKMSLISRPSTETLSENNVLNLKGLRERDLDPKIQEKQFHFSQEMIKHNDRPISFSQFQMNQMSDGQGPVQTEAKVIDSTGSHPEEMIQKVLDYLDTSKLKTNQEVQLRVLHDKIGEFQLKVMSGKDGVHIEVLSQRPEGSDFFKDNQFKIMNSLASQGLKVADFKIENSAMKFDQQGQSQHHSQSSETMGGRAQQQSLSQGQERRKELWEILHERMAA